MLHDSAETPRYIETVTRRGYRFLQPVEQPAKVEPDLAAPAPARQAESSVRQRWLAPLAVLAVAVLIAAVAMVPKLRGRKVEVTLEQITRDTGLTKDPAVSPDGKLLAYASDHGSETLNIWLKQLPVGGQAVQLTHGLTGDAHQPAFSPDGSTLVYRSEQEPSGIYKVPTIGGTPALVAARGRDPRYSPDGLWIAYWCSKSDAWGAPESDGEGTTWVVGLRGGSEPRRVAKDLPGPIFSVWSADSKWLLVLSNPRSSASAREAEWWTVPLDGSPARPTGAFAALVAQGFGVQSWLNLPRAADWDGEKVTFSALQGDSRNVWQIALRPGERASGLAQRRTSGTMLELSPAAAGANSWVFASMKTDLAMWSLPADTDRGVVTGGLEKLTDGSLSEISPSITRDGHWLTYGAGLAKHEDIWLKDLQAGTDRVLAGIFDPE